MFVDAAVILVNSIFAEPPKRALNDVPAVTEPTLLVAVISPYRPMAALAP